MYRMLALGTVFAATLFLGLRSVALSPPAPVAEIIKVETTTLTTYPATATPVHIQDVKPQVLQRGTRIEGSLRARAPHGMAIAANPFGTPWTGTATHNEVDLATGSYAPTEIDIALPAPGFSWTVGRTYNAAQKGSGSHHDSNGPQGKNWSQFSMPEIQFYKAAADEDDVVYLVYGADRFVEFKRHGSTDEQFNGRQGAAGVFLILADNGGSSSEPDTYTLTDQRGTKYTFFTPKTSDTDASPVHGQLWKIEDAAGNIAYVGHSSTASTAISSGYDGSGRITTAFDAADRRYTYTYSSGRLTQIEVETKSGGTWASPTGVETVALVEYAYYINNDSHGQDGDLKTVRVTDFGSDAAGDLVRVKCYRYWEGAYNASTNPGHEHALKFVYDFEGTRRFDWGEDGTESPPALDDGFLGATDSALESFASAYFEYDSSHRIREAWFNGECGCSGAGSGTHAYEYEANPNYSDTTGYQTIWAARTIVQRPDGTYLTQYFDEVGQPLHQVITDDDPDNTSPVPARWATKVVRDANGVVTDVHTPANITGYTHSAATMSISTSTSDGLVWTFVPVSSGDMSGFLQDRKYKQGTSGTAYYLEKLAYTSTSVTVGATTAVRPFVSSRKSYHGFSSNGTSGYNETSVSYTFHTGTLQPKEVTTTLPAVSGGNNGSGSSNTSRVYHRTDGLVAFEESPRGRIAYSEYTGGQLTKRIADANLALTGSGQDFENVSIPSGWSSPSSPLHQVTTHTYDPQGRRATTTLPNGRVTRVHHTKLADHRRVTLSYPKFVAGSPDTFYGPVGYSVRNLAGRVEAQGRIAFSGGTTTSSITGHIDDTDSDPILAVAVGSLARVSTSIYDGTGTRVEEERVYFDIPSSGAGTAGTNYDATSFAYDDMGRRWRVLEPSGTIRRTVFDVLGRTSAQWMGTNDSSFTGGSSSGTDNMVRTELLVYDGGSDDGNSYLTSQTRYTTATTSGQRVASFARDVRGHLLLETRPTAPHLFHKVDNLGRRVATGSYSSTGSITVGSDDPTSTTSSNRLALSETFYDEVGRVYKTTRHKIDASDGSKDDSLDSNTWYDADGNVIKIQGAEFKKMRYDGLGRLTHEFVLGGTDDTTYAHAADVTGDIVLEERQTVLEADDDHPVMRATIARRHNDRSTGQTTGALDTNADGDALLYTAANIAGRIQIEALWYDNLDRLADSVHYGTNGDSNFDRDGLSVPGRSATALRTSYSYGDDGEVQHVTDPRELVQRNEYDDAGRVTKVIRNYDSGVNSGNPDGSDDNVTVRYEYTSGLRTKLIADLPSGSTDQETLYIYGTTAGTPSASAISTGHLLRAIVYPDSTNTGTTAGAINSDDSDVVSFAYNVQGEEVRKKDQAGNVFETVRDDAGRLTLFRVETLATGFDGHVRRRETAYDDLGRPSTVVQWSAATGGSERDGVKYTYDGWGNVTSYRQDSNSAVDASGSVDDYEVTYTWVKATIARNALRRSSIGLPSGASVSLNYRSSNGLFDDAVSRVTSLTHGTTAVVGYDYLGLGQVVGTDYPEPWVRWRLYEGSTSGVYADLDRFGRVVHSRWLKHGQMPIGMSPPNIYHVELGYDENSNIVTAKDHVHAGFDVLYKIDGIDRLTRAHEGSLVWDTSEWVINDPTRDQEWELDQVGNWERDKLDLDGDTYFTGTDEWDDCRTHNDVNEILTRDLDCTPGTTGDNHSLSHDAAGNLTDDGKDYKYVYDAFYRLRKILNRSNDDLVSEHRYNGLGHRIAVHADTDDDGDVDGDDEWEYLAYDERWRLVARFINAGTVPRQEFVHHQAGLDGHGSSSYIDLVVLRDRDTNANGTLDERVYYCQNWRADVSALVTSAGEMLEWVKYSAYGVPFGLPAGDADSDGDRDSADRTQITAWASAPIYDVRGDLNLDGLVDSADEAAASGDVEMGRGVLSGSSNQVGFAGYKCLVKGVCANWSVRLRVYSAFRGSWLSRDPGGYIDGVGLYQYVQGRSVIFADWSGRYTALPSGGTSAGGGGPLLHQGGPLSGINEENCCRLGKSLGLDAGDAGGGMCCAGVLVLCVWLDRADADATRERYHGWKGDPYWEEQGVADSYAQGFLIRGSDCVRKHEEHHRDKGHFASCVGINLGRAGWSMPTQEAKNEMEQEARKVEYDCLSCWDMGAIDDGCDGTSDPSACSQGGNDRLKFIATEIENHN